MHPPALDSLLHNPLTADLGPFAAAEQQALALALAKSKFKKQGTKGTVLVRSEPEATATASGARGYRIRSAG